VRSPIPVDWATNLGGVPHFSVNTVKEKKRLGEKVQDLT